MDRPQWSGLPAWGTGSSPPHLSSALGDPLLPCHPGLCKGEPLLAWLVAIPAVVERD